MQTAEKNITAALLTVDEWKPSGTDITYYLSPDNGTTWENAQSGVVHVFTMGGKELKWMANLTTHVDIEDPGDYSTIPIIRNLEILVSKGNPSNISVDLGYDGTSNWNFTGELNATNSTIVNISSSLISKYLTDHCINEITCLVPVSIYTESSGVLTYRNIEADAELMGVDLGASTILDVIGDNETYHNFFLPRSR